MGNLPTSEPKERYVPRQDPQRPKDRIYLQCTLGNHGLLSPPFYVDFDDPESLERELRRFNMAGIIVHVPRLCDGWFVCLVEEHPTTDLLFRARYGAYYRAVYPIEYCDRAIHYMRTDPGGPMFLEMRKRRLDIERFLGSELPVDTGPEASNVEYIVEDEDGTLVTKFSRRKEHIE
ncbi:hypothetical protein TWF694_003644 [Orbilia ellipsospora]|uniref:Uncharacterized protein n=1 Tax=Orbilia ellipsospora TaxID=2528407 RepID=A0AAV9WYQ1_9PEZI